MLRRPWAAGFADNLNTCLSQAGSAGQHHTWLNPVIPSLDDQVQRLVGFRTAFPDIQIVIEEVVAEGDYIALRSTMRGTHKGELMGIAPTGKQVTVGLVDVIRVKDGKFVEQWGGPDLFDLLRQLGAVFTVATEGNQDWKRPPDSELR